MPKQSKVRSTRAITISTKPDDDQKRHYCATCGKDYSRQKQNFPMSQSPLYKGNNGYISTCRNCVDELFDHYKQCIGDEKEALKRICMKFDIYWNEEIYEMLSKANTSTSRVLTYISRSNLIKYQGKTFDDTLDEEYNSQHNITLPYITNQEDNTIELSDNAVINEDVIEFWGPGFTTSMYLELESRYKFWLSQYPDETTIDAGEKAILRQICNLEVDINRDRVAGKPIDKSVNTLNTLLGSANLKPTQRKENENSFIPFGVEIANFEKEHPIIDPDPEFEDVDGIKKNITAWFLGHLCKMCGIKNSYVKEYENEIEKYTLERPTYEEDESDTPDTIFLDSGDDDG